jgi:hypothetical protein
MKNEEIVEQLGSKIAHSSRLGAAYDQDMINSERGNSNAGHIGSRATVQK